MAHVVKALDAPSTYVDWRALKADVDKSDTKEVQARKMDEAAARQRQALAVSSTLYLGNLSFYTTEAQIYELFSRCASESEGGGIKRIVMGLDRENRTPCGFAFVEYYLRSEALASMRYISGTKLDERIIRCDIDPGFKPGREFGRGESGGQVRDEWREDYDGGRGGYGKLAEKAREEEKARRDTQDKKRRENLQETYAPTSGRDAQDIPTGDRPKDSVNLKRGREGSAGSDDGRDAPYHRGEKDEEEDDR